MGVYQPFIPGDHVFIGFPFDGDSICMVGEGLDGCVDNIMQQGGISTMKIIILSPP